MFLKNFYIHFIPAPQIFIVHILCAKYCVRSGIYKLFLKGEDNKILGFVNYMVSIITTQLCLRSMKVVMIVYK